MRFKENRVALVGDIEKAFLNISVDVSDRGCLRFLWADDVSDTNPNYTRAAKRHANIIEII